MCLVSVYIFILFYKSWHRYKYYLKLCELRASDFTKDKYFFIEVIVSIFN